MLCPLCKTELGDNYIIISGKSFHKDCYIVYSADILEYIEDNIVNIIDATQDNNSRANSIARNILRKLHENSSD